MTKTKSKPTARINKDTQVDGRDCFNKIDNLKERYRG